MTTHLAAAAGGLPNLSRRHFLSRGAVAVSATALPAAAAPVLSEAAPAVTASGTLAAAVEIARRAECPDLLKLGADMALARKRYVDAQSALEAARDAALRLAPAIPEGLPVAFAVSVFGQIAWYGLPEPADILGNAIELPRYVSPKSGKTFPVRIPTTADIIKDRQSARRVGGGSSLPAWFKGEHRRLFNLAVEFERATDDARESSGLNDAEDELWSAGYDLVVLCEDIAGQEAQTIVGLLIQAQAIAAAASVPRRGANASCYASGLLPEAVCRVLGGSDVA